MLGPTWRKAQLKHQRWDNVDNLDTKGLTKIL